MKAYVINLERAAQRRRHILRQLKSRKMDYTFVPGVDGRRLTAEELRRLCDLEEVQRRPNKLTTGALGCALSHLAAYQKLLRSNLEMALVLEDDAVLPKGLNELLEVVEKNIQKNEVILLHYFKLNNEVPMLSQHDAARLTEKYSLMYPVNFPYSGTAYVITREAARTLSAIKLPINAEADDWNYFYAQGAIESLRCVYPIPIRTSCVDTQVQPSPEDAAKTPLRHKITKFVYDNEFPLLYSLLLHWREYRHQQQSFSPAKVVDQPSIVRQAVGDF